ncbi:DegT/DnrJ/EryC1/StrS family aminotransferase [Saccharopolyspora erythraea]|uniref:DegT/DnrJ/EryC1/StrS family aminotransferase n=1 Tax=Saccharopolyspora erythraea TaxID=1836 RepID=UPI001BA9ABED|nr:DegT/DnrJ/EryC1/StrS family aminotransferase [Saccharopolyspora erythraea]QUH00063.1 DegT/DnrJ/EryC1/StrS family aminotransferase [Saccharopolyspora erythraea]
MDVPFLDLQAAYLELRSDIDQACRRVLGSGWYLHGPENEAFEAEFAAYCENAHCVTVGSGCDALELSLLALGVGQGDEVIVPSHTFIATWLAVSRVGAVPVPVEPEGVSHTLDPELVEQAITPRTAAILPVHLYGHPADLDALRAIADRHGLALVEDVAQAVGARQRGHRIGAGSTAAAFSFYPGKNLGALGDGGAVVTTDPTLAERIRLLRNYGSKQKYVHEVRGTNARLDELQAAVLRVKLRHLDDWNARRTTLAQHYQTELKDLPGITLPEAHPWADSAWHLFVLRCQNRDRLQGQLSDAGVQTLIHYPTPVHLSPAYTDLGLPPGTFPRAESLAGEVLSLPIGPHLSRGAADHVIATLKAAV